ncbi:hypothetical protein SCLCIDRAFT_927663 [Scleroderma citrinum Foug A]|uniref:Uncharacterized protein n=1 Tax=Scleroderma citrinum Foug A TaxID=1036808 RepID=A0A0C2ZGF6_9AGAM|nr:hypothetical protein SCLCIDRAFT_927663 [Scleroderma citrinum Foug A]
MFVFRSPFVFSASVLFPYARRPPNVVEWYVCFMSVQWCVMLYLWSPCLLQIFASSCYKYSLGCCVNKPILLLSVKYQPLHGYAKGPLLLDELKCW